MASTLNGTGVTFSDGTTQNSASAFLAVGTVALLVNFSRSGAFANSTALPASSLGYPSSGSTVYLSLDPPAYRLGNVTVPGAGIVPYSINTTAVSGTWRSVGGVGSASYDGCANTTYCRGGLFVRVS